LLRFQAGYSEELAARVHTLYAADFEAFDYDPRSWPRDELEVATVSQEQIIDAIIERNLVISHLYEEKERLQALYLQACRSPEPQ
jgi:hypothetical protein